MSQAQRAGWIITGFQPCMDTPGLSTALLFDVNLKDTHSLFSSVICSHSPPPSPPPPARPPFSPLTCAVPPVPALNTHTPRDSAHFCSVSVQVCTHAAYPAAAPDIAVTIVKEAFRPTTASQQRQQLTSDQIAAMQSQVSLLAIFARPAQAFYIGHSSHVCTH